jgi:phosphoribosylformylglycinamidine cyclo-ligase
VEGTPLDAGKLVLSPTRTYAPVIKRILDNHRAAIHGMVHCSGGAQTKVGRALACQAEGPFGPHFAPLLVLQVLHFIDSLHVIKDNLFPVPPLFELIQHESGTGWKEMYQVRPTEQLTEHWLLPPSFHACVSAATKLSYV